MDFNKELEITEKGKISQQNRVGIRDGLTPGVFVCRSSKGILLLFAQSAQCLWLGFRCAARQGKGIGNDWDYSGVMPRIKQIGLTALNFSLR